MYSICGADHTIVSDIFLIQCLITVLVLLKMAPFPLKREVKSEKRLQEKMFVAFPVYIVKRFLEVCLCLCGVGNKPFVDDSSAFNTAVSSKIVTKLRKPPGLLNILTTRQCG